MSPQEVDELIDRSGRMTDRPDCWMLRHGEVWHRARGIATGENQSGGIFPGSISSSRSRPFAMCSVL
jgi:hypothetical protein